MNKTLFRHSSHKVNKIGRNIILIGNKGTRLDFVTINSYVDDCLTVGFTHNDTLDKDKLDTPENKHYCQTRALIKGRKSREITISLPVIPVDVKEVTLQ